MGSQISTRRVQFKHGHTPLQIRTPSRVKLGASVRHIPLNSVTFYYIYDILLQIQVCFGDHLLWRADHRGDVVCQLPQTFVSAPVRATVFVPAP